MDIRLARIDDRLIHGQVATVWSKECLVDRILVISDEVAKDPLRKFMLREAAPPGVFAHVLPVERFLAVNGQQLFENEKVMLLFTGPAEAARLVHGGLKLKSINIGGMSFSVGKKMITNFISVDEKDISAFSYLAKQGIELEIRKVPTDRKVSLMTLLKKEKSVTT